MSEHVKNEGEKGEEYMNIKADCYKCKYRGTIPGDCHSKCNHPKPQSCNIKGNKHGISSGWFMWPWNFDPVWLENCNGFENKEAVSDSVSQAISPENKDTLNAPAL